MTEVKINRYVKKEKKFSLFLLVLVVFIVTTFFNAALSKDFYVTNLNTDT